MKNLIKSTTLLMFLFLGTSVTNQQGQSWDEYNRGYKVGYVEGWRDIKGQLAVAPVVPVTPMAEAGLMTYNGGYNKGFKDGRAKAQISR